MNEKGISLIELLVAMVLTVSVVVSTSIFFPRVTQATLMNQQRMEAKVLASSKVEEVIKATYDFVPLTSTGTYFTSGCDCASVNFAVLPASATKWTDNLAPLNDVMTSNGVSYTRKVCVNQVQRTTGGGSIAYCPPPNAGWTDTGLKNIRIQVTWVAGKQSQTLETSRLLSRQ